MKNHQEQERRYTEAFDMYSDALFRHAFFRVSNRQVAIDLVQDAFMKTWSQVAKGENIENYQSYLYHVLSNLIVDYYRKKKSLSLDTLTEDGFDPVGSTAANVMEDAVRRELMDQIEKLSDRDKEVVVMRYIDGLPVKEIAEILEESENSVSVRIHRAIDKLKETFHTNNETA